jgi:hypothetical protein
MRVLETLVERAIENEGAIPKTSIVPSLRSNDRQPELDIPKQETDVEELIGLCRTKEGSTG